MSSEIVDGEGDKKGATTRCKKWLAGDELGRHLLSVLRHDRRGKIIKLCSHTFTLCFCHRNVRIGWGWRKSHSFSPSNLRINSGAQYATNVTANGLHLPCLDLRGNEEEQ